MRKVRKLSEIFEACFQKPEFKTNRLQYDVENTWRELMSEPILQATTQIKIIHSCIEISINNSLLKNELHYTKSALIKIFSEKANFNFTDITFK